MMEGTEMRQRSRIQATVTGIGLLALAATAAGCSAGGSGQSEAGGKTITVATLQADYFSGCMQDVIPAFENSTGIKVQLVALPYNGMLDKYQANFSTGKSSYDVMTVAFQWTGSFAASGFLEPSSSKEVDGMSTTLVNQYKYDGKQYGLPFNSSVMGYFYRTDVLQRMGEKFPTTQDGLNTLLGKLAADPQLKADGITPTSVMGDKTQSMANFNSIYHSLGGPAFENSKSEPNPIDVDIATQTFKNLKLQVDSSPAGALSATFATTPADFAAGKVALLPVWNTTVGNTLESGTSKVAGKYSFALTPGGSGDLGGWGNVIPAASSNKDAAQKFVDYIASPAVDLKCSLDKGKSPVQKENFENADLLKVLPYQPAVPDILAKGTPRYTGKNAGTLNDIVNSVTSQFLAGQYPSAHDAAQDLAKQISHAS